MKKTQLRKIIKESIKQLMTEQSGVFVTQPFFNLTMHAQMYTTSVSTQFIGNIITAIINKHPQGKGCQFVCNRLAHFVNKYNTKAQAAITSGAGAAQGGFGNTNQGKILAGKVNYLAVLGANYNFTMCQVTGGTTQSCGMTSGGCGCPPPTMM